MKKWFCLAIMATFSAALVLSLAASGTAQDKSASTKELMGALHKAKGAPLPAVKKALAADSPNWKAVKKASAKLVELGSQLPSGEPKKGDKDAFKKLAEAYAAECKALNEAAGKEDKEAANAAVGKLGASCMVCHKAHR